MGNSVRDKHVPFVRFALIYVESGTSLTIGVGLGTGRKKVNGTQFPFGYSGWEFWSTSEDVPFISEIFRSGEPK